MWLVVGLGNPGDEYARNRHNIGFMAADELVRRHSFGPWKAKHQGLIADGTIGRERAMVLKPTTFMNLSGRSVGEVCRFYKIPLDRLIVLHDELELPPGKLRVKRGGGHAGHNGLRDIDAHLDKDYLRVRLGIGRPQDKAQVHGWVLGNFNKADQSWLDDFLGAVAVHLPLLLGGDEGGFMNKVTLATRPPPPPKPKAAPATPAAPSASTSDHKDA